MDLDAVLRALEVAGISGVRASWVLLIAAVAGALGYVVFPGPLHFLATWPGVGAVAVFAVVEHLAERDTDMLQILGAVQYGLSAATALLGTDLVARHASVAPPWAIQTGAVVLAVTTIAARRQLKLRLMRLSASLSSPAKWLARVEESAVLLALALVVLSPFLLLGVMLGLALLAALSAVLLRVLDRARRVACGGCGHLVRREAQRCPKCKSPLAPARPLTLKEPLFARLSALGSTLGDQPEDAAPRDPLSR